MTKGHLDNPEEPVEVKSPRNRKLFLTHLISTEKKKVFSKKGFFIEASDPWMLYCSKICCMLDFNSFFQSPVWPNYIYIYIYYMIYILLLYDIYFIIYIYIIYYIYATCSIEDLNLQKNSITHIFRKQRKYIG